MQMLRDAVYHQQFLKLLVLFVNHRWQSIEYQEVEMIYKLPKLLNREVPDALVVVEVKNLVCLVTRLILAKKD